MGPAAVGKLCTTRWLLFALAAAALVLASCGDATPSGSARPTVTPASIPALTTTTTSSAPAVTVTRTASGALTGTAAPTTGASTTRPAAPRTRSAAPTTHTAAPTAGSVGAPTAAKAIGAWMATKGFTYAGDCASTRLESDIGKHCSSLWENRGNERIYKIGPTFSEYTTWLLVERTGGAWRVSASTREIGKPPPW